MFKKVYLMGVILALIAGMGCITVDYDAQQEFREDGTSTISIDEYIGLNKESMEDYYDMSDFGSEDPSTIAAMLMLQYYTTEEYADALCSFTRDVKCEGKNDGYIYVEAELEPGDFYTVEKETDWVEFKEVTTYEIEKAPMAMYYVYENNEDVDEIVKENAVDYALTRLDEELTQDYYCEEYSYPDVLCEINSMSGGEATLELTGDSYSGPVKVQWIGCSDSLYSNFIFVYNNSDAEELLDSMTVVNEILAYGDTMTKTVDCPENTKTIVVAYESESYYSEEMVEDLAVFEVMSKEDIMDSIEEELSDGTESLSSSLYASSFDTSDVDVDDMFLNFRKAEIAGIDLEQLSEASGEASTLYNMEINVEYEAEFPNTVASAEIDREELKVRNNKVKVEMDDFEHVSGDYLIVTTEKQISPLGSFTWVAIIGIAVVVIAAIVMAARK